jgi:hypothetical protein
MNVIRAIPASHLDEAAAALMKVLDDALQRRRARPASPDAADRSGGNAESAHAPTRGRTGKDDAATTRTARRRRTSS